MGRQGCHAHTEMEADPFIYVQALSAHAKKLRSMLAASHQQHVQFYHGRAMHRRWQARGWSGFCIHAMLVQG